MLVNLSGEVIASTTHNTLPLSLSIVSQTSPITHGLAHHHHRYRTLGVEWPHPAIKTTVQHRPVDVLHCNVHYAFFTCSFLLFLLLLFEKSKYYTQHLNNSFLGIVCDAISAWATHAVRCVTCERVLMPSLGCLSLWWDN